MRRPGLAVLVVLGAVLALGAAASGCTGPPTTPPRTLPPASSEHTAPPPADSVPTPGAAPTEPTAAPRPPSTKPTPPETPSEPKPSDTGTAPTDNKTRAWYYVANTAHRIPEVAPGAEKLLSEYSGRYVGPDAKRVYLTFDEGYENGNTGKILDALSRNSVAATFFVTESYIRNNPELVRRMVREGHVVGNHSSTHPSMPTLSNRRSAFAAELTKTEKAFDEATGASLAKIFRPPKGEYSPLSLWLTELLGYESAFWSFAHRDWVVDDQPPVSTTVSRILGGSHPGAIYLLHGVSSSDTNALDDAIAGLRKQGYGFGTLGR